MGQELSKKFHYNTQRCNYKTNSSESIKRRRQYNRRHRADRRVKGWLRRDGWFAKVDNVFLRLGGFAKVDNRFGYEKWLQGGSKGWIHLYKRYV
jgi:hypothetical protein